MKSIVLSLLIIIGSINLVYCQITKNDIDNKFINKWRLKSVEVGNKPKPLNSKQQNAYAVFSKDSTYTNTSDNGHESGRWYFDYKKQLLIFNDQKDDSPDIKIKIERLTEKECVLFFSETMNGSSRVFLEKVE